MRLTAQKSSSIQNYISIFLLVVRLYDEGLAYRFVTANAGPVPVVTETRVCRFADDPLVYFGAEDKGFFSHTEVTYEPTRLSALKRDRLASLPMRITTV